MHEMGIACSILDAVRIEAVLHAPSKVRKVGLRIGEWSGVDTESLRFSFEAMVQNSDLEPLALEIEFRRRQNYCRICDQTFPLEDFEVRCPTCGGVETEPSAGTELDIAYLELEN
jgi:hydrogenase nickel incorporation protein HypA/HybF